MPAKAGRVNAWRLNLPELDHERVRRGMVLCGGALDGIGRFIRGGVAAVEHAIRHDQGRLRGAVTRGHGFRAGRRGYARESAHDRRGKPDGSNAAKRAADGCAR